MSILLNELIFQPQNDPCFDKTNGKIDANCVKCIFKYIDCRKNLDNMKRCLMYKKILLSDQTNFDDPCFYLNSSMRRNIQLSDQINFDDPCLYTYNMEISNI